MRPEHRWLSRVRREEGKIYLAILSAMEAAIRAGELQPGDQLPPQRTVAETLGVDVTTVTRAYGAARSRGWIEGAVGRGTFVTARALEDDPGVVDLSMNLPPPPNGVSLGSLLRQTTETVLQRADAARLMAYHPGTGAPGQLAAGAAWLAPCLTGLTPERMLVGPGAQTILAGLLSAITTPGDRVVVEPLTYPGFKDIAAALGLSLVPCPVDGDGLIPEKLDRLCREHSPRAIYVVPTMQNPTATTVSLPRRRDIAKLATGQDVWLIEDDPYSRLLEAPPPAIATFAASKTFYLATLSKCLSPGLRVAFLACPSEAVAHHVSERLRAMALMPPPLMTAIVTSWIRDGSAETLLKAVRSEACARRQLAKQLLPQATAAEDASIHVWLELPARWHPESLRVTAHARGLSLVTADSFAVESPPRNGVRISLGGPESREVLTDALKNVAELVGAAPRARRLVV